MEYNKIQKVLAVIACVLALILPAIACASDYNPFQKIEAEPVITVQVSAPREVRPALTRADSAAVWIVVWRTNGKAALGQGVVVAPKKVLTCAHVVKDAYQIVVFAFDPRTKPDTWMQGDGWTKMKLVNKDEASDLAVITDDTAVKWTGKINALADMDYEEGYLCLAGTTPLFGQKEGVIPAVVGTSPAWEFWTERGNSGAPILNRYGELIGIVTGAGMSRDFGLTRIVSWQAIRAFLK